MTRSTLSVALYLSIVFVSGVVAGVLGYRLYTTETTAKATEAEHRKPTPEEWRARFIDAMEERLALSDAQISQLNEILDRTKTRFDELERESRDLYRPRKRAIIDQQNAEIMAMLDQVQQSEYEKFRAERAERRRKAHEK